MKKKTPEDYGIGNYTKNPDGSLSVEGYVDLSNCNLKVLPFQFKEVTGDFYCSNNKLTSLKGAPLYVGGNFACHNNKIKSLIYAPKKVGLSFICSFNKLLSLKGVPRFMVNADYFGCEGNPKKFTKEDIEYALNTINSVEFIKDL